MTSYYIITLKMFAKQFVVLLTAIQIITAAVPCQTPSGNNGNCVPITECQHLMLLLNNQLTGQTGKYLRSHQCGFAGDIPKVCCTGNLLPNTIECGRSTQKKIYGGEKTELDEFPWMVLLEYERENGTIYFNCGGALISKRYVLTAAHCIKSNLKSVRLGEYNTQTDIDCIKEPHGQDCAPKHVIIPVEEKIPYENYMRNDTNQYNDIALVRLEREVDFSDFIRPICLPSQPEQFQKSYVGSKLDIAGWGLTEHDAASNIKLKLRIPVRNNSDCETKYRSYSYNLTLGTSQLCAGGELGRDSCRGDSGGPLMTFRLDENKDPNWYAVGLVSFGPSPCGMESWPGVYTRTSTFMGWILSKLKP